MPVYRIHRMKDSPRQSFRWAPHTAGVASLKPKDYECSETLDAVSPYGAWAALQQTPGPLRVGDLLEAPDGALRICKYVGLEEARWAPPDGEPAAAVEALADAGPA